VEFVQLCCLSDTAIDRQMVRGNPRFCVRLDESNPHDSVLHASQVGFRDSILRIGIEPN